MTKEKKTTKVKEDKGTEETKYIKFLKLETRNSQNIGSLRDDVLALEPLNLRLQSLWRGLLSWKVCQSIRSLFLISEVPFYSFRSP